jgi:hypothetical protein
MSRYFEKEYVVKRTIFAEREISSLDITIERIFPGLPS